ncbi:sensor histidine kinase [Porcipelethomonas sp.]|uniref:sensor histidine kinase n=1 Tax=Porcipelethomonas sp. TaxID=2981675 RepID=UPI003EF4190F
MVINNDENVQSGMESIKDSLNTAMTSIRESVHNLHDDSVNLKSTVTELSVILNERFEVQLELDFSENMPKNVKYCFIGIVKEGISNIIRHSNGNTANITIREHPAFYQLMITDNGTNSSKSSETGIGLLNMKERAENLGGIFKCYVDKNSFKIFVSIKKQESTV